METMIWNERLRQKFKETGWSKAEFGRRADVSYHNVLKYLAGGVDQPRGQTIAKLASALGMSALELGYGVGDVDTTSDIPVMGYIGAGAEIEPDYEHIPHEGIYQVKLPLSVPKGMAAFVVKGDSILPRYDDGDVILVRREQRPSLESFYGEEAAVRTADGRRFLKQLSRAVGGVNLVSWNARTIENVSVVWVGEIYVTIRASQLRRMHNENGKK